MSLHDHRTIPAISACKKCNPPETYAFRSGVWHWKCLATELIRSGHASPAARDMYPEEALRQIEGSGEWSDRPGLAPRAISAGRARCAGCNKETA